MIHVTGTVENGYGHFRLRIDEFPEFFREATGESLYPGTLNVRVAKPIRIREHFRIRDPIDTSQDLLFEVCRANGLWAYRIRPLHLETGEGGHGDDTIEIACAQIIPHAGKVELEFFR